MEKPNLRIVIFCQFYGLSSATFEVSLPSIATKMRLYISKFRSRESKRSR